VKKKEWIEQKDRGGKCTPYINRRKMDYLRPGLYKLVKRLKALGFTKLHNVS